MKTAILIPARYASSRYPGKPLARLRQSDGSSKTLIEMTWDAARAVPGDHAIYVATDDDRIRTACEGFGATVLMTPDTARNGTERCAAALDQIDADLIVNLQGDAPLTPPWFITALIERMAEDRDAAIATPVLRCDRQTYDMFIEDRKADRVGGTTAVFDRNYHGLYFSKEVLPFIDRDKLPDPIPVFHHVGVYAYRPDALRAYMAWPEGELERREGLEQLRFLENGAKVACVEVDARGRVFWELNNPADVTRIEAVLGKS